MAQNKEFTYDKLAIIIPFNGFEKEDDAQLLDRCIKSIPQEVSYFVVCNEGAADQLPSELTEDKIIKVDTDGSFCQNVNAGVKALDSQYEWVSVGEFDDAYNASVLTANVEKYIKAKEDHSVFLSLQYVISAKDGMFVGYTNESPLAMTFEDEEGEIDAELLKDVFVLNLTGSIIKRELFEKYDGLRGNIKIFFWYEWLYRIAQKEEKIFVMPKVMYNHFIMREGSLFDTYQKTITERENNYWMNVAKESSKKDEDSTEYQYKEAGK